MIDRWVKIPGSGKYWVSDTGTIKNEETDRILQIHHNQNGLSYVSLSVGGIKHNVAVHRLVAEAYIFNHDPEIYNAVIFLDGDRTNCDMSNLMWRPRWYAVEYMQQFPDHIPYYKAPVVEIVTDELFDNSWDAARKFGLLDKTVYNSVLSGDKTYLLPLYFVPKK